jgi:hypothetical protein
MIKIDTDHFPSPIIHTSKSAAVDAKTPEISTVAPGQSSGKNRASSSGAQYLAGFGRLAAVNDSANRTAAHIKAEQRRMDQIHSMIESIKRQVLRIIKNYPPYQQGDEKRIEYLKSIIGLRHEIEKFIIPPDDKWQGPQLGEAIPTTDAALASTTQTDQAAGMPQFDIPRFAETTTDSDLKRAMATLDNAQRDVIIVKDSLNRQAASVIADAGSTKMVEVKKINQDIQLTPTPDQTVEKKSKEISAGLNDAASTGLTISPYIVAIAG